MILYEGLCSSSESSFEQHCSVIELDANDGEEDDLFQVKYCNNSNQTILREHYYQQRKCEKLRENNFIGNFSMESISGGQKNNKFQPNMQGLINQRREQQVHCQNESDYERVLREIEKSKLHKQYEELKIPQHYEQQHKQQRELSSLCSNQECQIDFFNKQNYVSEKSQTNNTSSGHCNQNNTQYQEILQNKLSKNIQLSKIVDQSIPSRIGDITTTLKHENEEDHKLFYNNNNNRLNQLQDISNGLERQRQHQQEEQLDMTRRQNYQTIEAFFPCIKHLNQKAQELQNEINYFQHQRENTSKRIDLSEPSNDLMSHYQNSHCHDEVFQQHVQKIQRNISEHNSAQDKQSTKLTQLFLNNKFVSPSSKSSHPYPLTYPQSSTPCQFQQNQFPEADHLPLSTEQKIAEESNNNLFFDQSCLFFLFEFLFHMYKSGKMDTISYKRSISKFDNKNKAVLDLTTTNKIIALNDTLLPTDKLLSNPSNDSLRQQQQQQIMEKKTCEQVADIDMSPFRSERCKERFEKQYVVSDRFGTSWEQQNVAFERNQRESEFNLVREQQQGNEGFKKRSLTPNLQYNQSLMARQLSDLFAQKKANQMKDLEINNKHIEEEQVKTYAKGDSKTISKISQMILCKLETANKTHIEEKLNGDRQNKSHNKREFDQVSNSCQAKQTPFFYKSTFKLLVNKKKKCNPEQKQVPLETERGTKQQQKTADNFRYSSNTSSRNTSQNNKSTELKPSSGIYITTVFQKCMTERSADARKKNETQPSKAQPNPSNHQEKFEFQCNKTIPSQKQANKENVLADNHLYKMQDINDQSRIPRFYSNESLQKSLLIRQNCSSKSREISPNLNPKSSRESTTREENTSRMQKQDKLIEQKSIESLKNNQQSSLSQLIDQARKNNQRTTNSHQIMQNRNTSRMTSTQELQQSNSRNHTPPTPINITRVDKNIKNPCKLIIARKKTVLKINLIIFQQKLRKK